MCHRLTKRDLASFLDFPQCVSADYFLLAVVDKLDHATVLLAAGEHLADPPLHFSPFRVVTTAVDVKWMILLIGLLISLPARRGSILNSQFTA
jgi:hypothetical protein